MTTREEYHAEMQKLREVPAAKPYRLNYSQIIDRLITRGRAQSEGTVLTLNAKGDVQAEVTTAVHEGETHPDATNRAIAELDRIRAKYPRENHDAPPPRK